MTDSDKRFSAIIENKTPFTTTPCCFIDAAPEIISFLEQIFELRCIRGKVGDKNGIVFCVRTKESNHSIPHVHASFQGHEISIAIENGEILAAKGFPAKKQKEASKWVIEHKNELLTKWSEIAIHRENPMVTSGLNQEN